MRLFRRLILSFILLLEIHQNVSAQENIVFFEKGNLSSISISLIDSITCQAPNLFNLHLFERENAITVPTDSALFYLQISDTLFITYEGNNVKVQNPHLERFRVDYSSMNVNVSASGKQPFVCVASGECENGRLIIDSDTTCTLVLSGLKLVSQEGSAIYFRQKQKSTIELSEGTINILEDAIHYNKTDTTDISCAALYSKGSISIGGTGILNVRGNYRHAIFSSKNLNIDDGTINILDAQKDGIHCDKYKQKGGTVNLHLTQTATKGIKTKEEFELKGGRIEGEATANLKIANGETSYCTFIKSDSLFTMNGGDIQLTHSGKGGRCISVDKNFLMTAGRMSLECHGDGGSYLTAANDSDYYTPKCITADDSVFIQSGHLTCLSTGLGGKGIVAGKHLSIGNEEEPNYDELLIRVETQGECIINDVDEDQRFGCPKGIKADSTIIIYGGDIAVTTAGMGGEGVECNGDMLVNGGTLECNTFDDGINVGRSIEIAGGQVYCNSVDNDGIDSNGSITVSGGIVASVNQQRPDESFDSLDGRFYLLGGVIFGLGSSPVKVQESACPFYSTQYDNGSRYGGLILTEDKYLYVLRGNEVIMAMKNINRSLRTFLTICHPSFMEDEPLIICEGDQPTGNCYSLFNEKLFISGQTENPYFITHIQVHTKH